MECTELKIKKSFVGQSNLTVKEKPSFPRIIAYDDLFAANVVPFSIVVLAAVGQPR